MKIRNNNNKKEYCVYMNFKINNEKNKIFNELIRILKTFNKSEIVSYLINSNKIVKQGDE